jgi:hypothetical protein
MLAEVDGGFAAVGGLGDLGAMAGRVVVDAGRMLGAWRSPRSRFTEALPLPMRSSWLVLWGNFLSFPFHLLSFLCLCGHLGLYFGGSHD